MCTLLQIALLTASMFTDAASLRSIVSPAYVVSWGLRSVPAVVVVAVDVEDFLALDRQHSKTLSASVALPG